jgi:hypothetical protein
MTSPIYNWYGYNKLLFQLINNFGDVRLDIFMQLGSLLGNPLWFPVYAGLLLAVGVYRSSKHVRNSEWSRVALWGVVTFTLWASCALGLVFQAYVNKTVLVQSPIVALGAGAVRLIGAGPGVAHTFLSAQAFFAMVLVVSLWTSLASHQRVAGALFVLWVGISRVYVGSQFPADVLAAWLSALTLGCLVRQLAFYAVPRIVAWWAGRRAHRARLQ